eukprot:TRINITY_DN12216_c0_g1_i1.p1 TRINITY_DN12216_c0_g1~~TRINITY_DN12216_c0_g1_i1.p1  ORF type:complete len:457 (+),score=128.17 TRINITY_DN12216_c0_g1_i1:34-1371(+)
MVKNSPAKKLEILASKAALEVVSQEFAEHMDDMDELRRYKEQFVVPTLETLPRESVGDQNQECIYLLGNSLGLKPKKADRYMQEAMDMWGRRAIYHHTGGRIPAAYADQPCKPLVAKIVGASDPSEVTVMNGLTVNLHLLMLAFYKPSGNRNKILIEDHAFPSDRYAARSLMRVFGVDETRLIIVKPRSGESLFRTLDIIQTINSEKDNLAMIMLPGVQYYTGQKLDMEAITRHAVHLGIPVGWDLAHAVGNVHLDLHAWGADFAVWCSYKYLNSGAGAIAGAFLHAKHHDNPPTHLEGWWSNKQETRFEMRDVLDPALGVESFRLCNPPPFLAALNLAALEMFEEVGMEKLLKKQELLTGYLEYLLNAKLKDELEILTPGNAEERGCQLSILFRRDVSQVHGKLENHGVVCDTRGKVMRVAPVPFYNSYLQVNKFVHILANILQ